MISFWRDGGGRQNIFLKWLKPPNVKFVNYDIPYFEIFPQIVYQQAIEIIYFQETIYNLS